LYKYLIFIISLLVLSGCSTKNLLENSHQLKSAEKKAESREERVFKNMRFEYKIAPHDRIKITVYAHPELSTNVDHPKGILVSSRGIVSLPLIGAVNIGGLTQPSASRRIQNRYGEYLKKSSIHLEALNKRAYIVGEVKKPGAIELPNEQTALLQAIATAGGLNDTANREKIVIIRKSGRGSKIQLIDLTNPTSLSYATMMIRPNDIIYIAPTHMKTIGTNITPIFALVSNLLLPFIRFQDLTD